LQKDCVCHAPKVKRLICHLYTIGLYGLKACCFFTAPSSSYTFFFNAIISSLFTRTISPSCAVSSDSCASCVSCLMPPNVKRNPDNLRYRGQAATTHRGGALISADTCSFQKNKAIIMAQNYTKSRTRHKGRVRYSPRPIGDTPIQYRGRCKYRPLLPLTVNDLVNVSLIDKGKK